MVFPVLGLGGSGGSCGISARWHRSPAPASRTSREWVVCRGRSPRRSSSGWPIAHRASDDSAHSTSLSDSAATPARRPSQCLGSVDRVPAAGLPGHLRHPAGPDAVVRLGRQADWTTAKRPRHRERLAQQPLRADRAVPPRRPIRRDVRRLCPGAGPEAAAPAPGGVPGELTDHKNAEKAYRVC